MFGFRAAFSRSLGLLALVLVSSAVSAQEPIQGQGTSEPADGIELSEVGDLRLLGAFERYRSFVVRPERLLKLGDLQFKVLNYVYEQEEGSDEIEERLVQEVQVYLQTADSFTDWNIRTESESQGQALILVSTPSQKGWASLGGVVQGHPVYGQRARQDAALWAEFYLRWFNPDLPLFSARYDSRMEREGDRPIDRVLLGLRSPQTGEATAAWRLLIDGTTGAPLSLETFEVETFSLQSRLDYLGYQEVEEIKFPKRCELFNAEGRKVSALVFQDVQVDKGLDSDLFREPK